MFKQIFMFCVLAVLLGLGSRVVQENPVPFWGFPEPIKPLPTPAYADESLKRSANEAFAPADLPYAVDYITTFSLYAKRKKESVHFVDARAKDLFEAGHIPGSINIPYEYLDKHIAKLEALPKEELIVVYCDGGDCRLSHDLAEYALSSGWTRLAIFEGGWEEWSLESDFIAEGSDE